MARGAQSLTQQWCHYYHRNSAGSILNAFASVVRLKLDKDGSATLGLLVSVFLSEYEHVRFSPSLHDNFVLHLKLIKRLTKLLLLHDDS